jgi:hypothetical protein
MEAVHSCSVSLCIQRGGGLNSCIISIGVMTNASLMEVFDSVFRTILHSMKIVREEYF